MDKIFTYYPVEVSRIDYTINIEEEWHDGELLYVGRCSEFPDLASFEDTQEEAWVIMVDAITTTNRVINHYAQG